MQEKVSFRVEYLETGGEWRPVAIHAEHDNLRSAKERAYKETSPVQIVEIRTIQKVITQALCGRDLKEYDEQ
jgi:hypothetical protein